MSKRIKRINVFTHIDDEKEINKSKEYRTNLNDFDNDSIIIDCSYLSDTKRELFNQISDLVLMQSCARIWLV